MSLELAVSQTLMRARALERALYDAGPWHIAIQSPMRSVMLRATRTITDNAVIFSVPLELRGHGDYTATLLCQQEPLLVRPLTGPGEEIIAVDWELRLSDAVSA